MTKEEKAFLDLIAFAEGTFGVSNNGYDVLLNDYTVSGKSRVMKDWTEDNAPEHKGSEWYVKSVNSTAAGRYQFISSTWKGLNGGVNVEMTKDNQDAAALKLLRNVMGSTYDCKVDSEQVMQSIQRKVGTQWDSFNRKSSKDLYDWYKRVLVKYS